MDIRSKALTRFLVALLIGIVGVATTLLLLSQGARAGAGLDAVWLSPALTSGSASIKQAGTPVSITLLPAAATVTAGQHISYTLIVTDDVGADWDATISGTYTITLGAGGAWAVNVYTAGVAGTWTVIGTYEGLTNTAVLTVTHAGAADIDLAPSTAVVTAGQSRSYTVTAIDAFDNSWDVTGDSSFAITSGADGSWMDNVYTSQVAGTWTVTGTYAEYDDTAALTVNPSDLDYIVLSPSASTIFAWQTQAYTVEAFDVYNNSRGDVTTESDFSIVGSGDGGQWTDNVYTPGNQGDWIVRAAHLGETDDADLTVLGPFLHLDKGGVSDVVEAGETLTYTITCSNTGNLTATNVIITDTLDPNVLYADASLTPTGGLPDAPYWSIGEIASGEQKWLTVTVSVVRPLTNGTTLANVAWLDANWLGAGRTDPLSDTEETTVHSQPVLSFSKAEYPDPVRAGGTLRYTLVMTNSGNESATSVVVNEQYDPNVSFSPANPPPDSGDDTWIFPVLEPDQPTSIDVFVEVADTLPVGTVLTNRATLDSDQTAPFDVSETTAVTSSSELVIYKWDSPADNVQAGEELLYVIDYQASGTAPAEGVVITEVYDSRVTFVSANPPPETGTDNVWDIGHLDVNESGIVFVTVRVDTPLPNGTVLTNHATIDSEYTSPQTCSETTRVASAPDLELTVTDWPDPVEPGTSLSYAVHYTNTGNADATQVVVTATLDANVSYVSASPTPTGGVDNVWYWEIDKVAGADGVGGFGHGEIVIHTDVTLPLTDGVPLDLTVQLGDAEGDQEEVIEYTIVTSESVLSFQKSDGVTTVEAGDRLTYVFDCTNTGTENAYDIVVTDTLPSYISYVGCEVDNGDCQPLPPGEPDKVVFHISAVTQTVCQAQLVVDVEDPLPPGAVSLVNTARMTHPSLAAPIDDEDIDSIATRPDLVVDVEYVPHLFSPGKHMSYTVSYSNTGRMHAEDVSITTVLPTDTVYVGYGWQSSDGQTYTYQVGDLLAGAPVQSVTFVVEYPGDEPQQIGVTDFSTPFFIVENGGTGEDSNPDDNMTDVDIGVPDLVVVDFTVEPSPLEPNVPSTVTVVIANQGTGWALNPGVYPGYAGSTVDVFLDPISSYPFEGYSEKGIWCEFPALAPGAEHSSIITLTKTNTGLVVGPILFSEKEILAEIQELYVKVDSLGDNRYGLVPESNEMNNVRYLAGSTDRLYLPLVLRQ